MDSCSFCDRPRNEVKSLIGAPKKPGLFICNRCLDTAKSNVTQEKLEETKEVSLPKPRAIKTSLDQYIIAQDEAKMDLAVAVYNHYKRRKVQGVDLGVEIDKSNVLMLGPTGVGKTAILRSLARILKVPFYVADATKLTSAGYVGDDVESLLQGLLADCGGVVEQAEWGIVYLDEADKLARKSGRNATGFRDVSGEGVQQALLKMVEGCRMPVPKGNARAGTTNDYLTMDTSNVLFIFGGSFAGIEEIVRNRINQSARVGFGSTQRRDLNLTEIYSAVKEEDILEFGIIPELLGRLPILARLKPLTEDQMVQILTEPKDALVKQFKALFALDNIELKFDDEALRAIGREANSRPTGARGLRSILEGVLKRYSYECPEDPTIRSLRITLETVQDGKEAVIERSPQVLTA